MGYAIQSVSLSTSEIRNFKPLVIFCECTDLFVLDMVGNPKDRISHDTALITIIVCTVSMKTYNMSLVMPNSDLSRTDLPLLSTLMLDSFSCILSGDSA